MHRIAEWKYHHHHSRRRHTSRRQQLALDNDDNNHVSNDDDGDDDNDRLHNMMTNNWTSILLQSTLHVPDDFSSAGSMGVVGGGTIGGEQLSRAILLWHLSAMAGNVESAMGTFSFHRYYIDFGTTTLLRQSC